MRGHIIKRYKNSYTIVLNLGVDPWTGKRKQQWVSVRGTKKDYAKPNLAPRTAEGFDKMVSPRR